MLPRLFPFILITNLALGQGPVTKMPDALQALESSRKAIANGRVEWTSTTTGEQERVLNFVSRYAANGDMIFEERGDDDGWITRNLQTGKGEDRFPRLYLKNSDGQFHYKETSLLAMWWGNPEDQTAKLRWNRVKDFRGVGLCASSWSAEDSVGSKSLWGSGVDPFVAVTQENVAEHVVVTAETENGARFRWYLNPEKGWNAERMTYEHGQENNEAIIVLEKYGDTWLPARSDFYHGGALQETIEIKSAELNVPNGPRRFTLADVGMQPGEQLAPQHKSFEKGKPPVWNGENVSEWDDWMADLKSGKRAWGARMQRVNRRESFESPYLTDEQRERGRLARIELERRSAVKAHEGLWSRYVRDFIAKYALNTEQTQKALVILSDCQRLANEYVTKKRDNFQQIQNDISAAQSNSNKEAEAKHREQMTRLRKPIDDIFAKQLVPRLDKLPTREQRRNAETQPASSSPNK